MNPHLYIGKEPNFNKIIVASVILHLVFITLITIPLRSREREYKSYFVNIVTPAQIRRTTSAPAVKKKGKTTGKSVKTKPSPRRRVRSPKGVRLESTDRLKNELQRMKAISAIAKLKKEKEEALDKSKEEEEELAEALEDIRKKKQISISTGPGAQGVRASTKTDAYSAVVRQQILAEWIHPEFESALEAIVSFKVNTNGDVIAPRIIKSSGNRIFDSSTIKAVKKASPLPPPAVDEEIEVRFHNEKELSS
ncbi:MAG: TonB family protein [Nitrospirota bacterium]